MFSADPVLGQVDLWWLVARLSGCELAVGTVRPGGVVVLQLLGQYLAQVALIDDQQPAGDLAPHRADHRLSDSVRSGCLRRAEENPDTFGGEHGIEGLSALAGAVPDQEMNGTHAMAQVHQEVTGGLGRSCAIRVGGDTAQMSAAGAVLDDDQGVDAPQQHRVHVDEVGCEDPSGLGGQELLPGWPGAPGRWSDPGVVQDLPDRGCGDRVAEPDKFAGDADHELADRGCRARPPAAPAACVVPFASHQATVPGKDGRRGHVEHLLLSVPWNQAGQRREPQPVSWLISDPAGLPAQDRILVPQHQQFCVLRRLCGK